MKHLYNWLTDNMTFKAIRRNKDALKGLLVDLGAGSCPYKKELLKYCSTYVAIDWNKSRHNNNGICVFADVSQPVPLRNDSVDAVVAFQVLEHLPEPIVFLKECNRVLKPEGRLLITVPFNWMTHEEPYDYYRFTKYGLEYLLEKAGFIVKEIRAESGFWQMMGLKGNYYLKRFARGPFLIPIVPIWTLIQLVAPVLDMVDFRQKETCFYTAVAKK